jgi:hypothetical protein
MLRFLLLHGEDKAGARNGHRKEKGPALPGLETTET